MWFNPIMIWLLRSPLHGLVSKNMMLISYTGRKSGRVYTIPVNYLADDKAMITISFRSRTWWRNLRGGAPVTVRVRGRDLKATADVIEADDAVAAQLTAYLQRAPHLAQYFAVGLDPNNEPMLEDVARAAQDKVLVRTKIA